MKEKIGNYWHPICESHGLIILEKTSFWFRGLSGMEFSVYFPGLLYEPETTTAFHYYFIGLAAGLFPIL